MTEAEMGKQVKRVSDLVDMMKEQLNKAVKDGQSWSSEWTARNTVESGPEGNGSRFILTIEPKNKAKNPIHEFDSSGTCNYCDAAVEKVRGGSIGAEECSGKKALER